MNDSSSEMTQTYQPRDAETFGCREAAIRKTVLVALGTPADLLRVSVVRLWGDNFRVNIWAGGPAAATIWASFFVTADADGAVLQAHPPIHR